MLPALPFLISTLEFGTVALLIFTASNIIFPIPVFATRGRTQVIWLLAVGFLLTVEAAVLITLGILVNSGDLWR